MTSLRAPALLALLLAAGCNQSTGLGGNGGPDMALPPPDMARGGPTIDPGPISMSNISMQEAETHVATASNGFVAVAYIGLQRGGDSTNGYRFSKDDGATWEPPASLDSPNGQVASDPVLATDAAGNFYMTWIGFKFDNRGQPYDMHVWAAKAPAGTTTFGAPVEVTSNPQGRTQYDKPWILVLNDGSILVTYAKTSTGGIFAATTRDFATWNTATMIEDGGFRNLVFPCQPTTGSRVYVTHAVASNQGISGIGLRWSNDGGVTWEQANRSAVAAQGEMLAFDDPSCAAEGNEVWVSYGLTRDRVSNVQSPKLSSIRIAHSTDGGMTIADRFDGHDAGAATYFMHPYIVREQNGALDLVYYAGNSEGDPMGSFRRSRSTDGGRTWATSMTVRSPITYLGARASQQWLGDYVGLAWARNNVYTAFVDNSSGTAHVAFYRTAAPMP